VCQIVWMRRKIWRFFATFAVATAACGAASAQMQGGADWDPAVRQLGGGGQAGTASPAVPRDASLEQLNKYLAVPQLPATNRSFYLSIRAFLLSRAGRDADSQKDIVEMGKVLPEAWPITMWGTIPGLAGGGDRAAALRTLDFALQRKPNDPWLLVAQAQVYMQIADFRRAQGILDGAVAAARGPVDRRLALFNRGQANFDLGNFQQAADDFDSSVAGVNEMKAKLGSLLWRYAAQIHSKQDARAVLNRDIGNENLYVWPGPIAKFLIGKLPAGELEVAAESDETAKRTNGKCPAAFFMGMEAERRGDKQRAREQLQLAQARCPTVSEYNWAASSELKRL